MLESSSLSPEVLVTFVEDNGSPMELLQIDCMIVDLGLWNLRLSRYTTHEV